MPKLVYGLVLSPPLGHTVPTAKTRFCIVSDMKTNKSYTKRLRLTKKGKILSRAPGQNHFNAKRSGSETMRHKRVGHVKMSNQERSRFLPN